MSWNKEQKRKGKQIIMREKSETALATPGEGKGNEKQDNAIQGEEETLVMTSPSNDRK